MWEHAQGMDDSPIGEAGLPKSVSRETTFEEDVDDRRVLEAMLYYLTERAARHLRSLPMQARCVSVKLRYSDFETLTRSRTLDRPTHHDAEFYRVARALLEKLYTRRLRVRLVGLCLSSLTPRLERQADFVAETDYVKRSRLYHGLDRVRERFGFSILTVGPSLRLVNDLERDEQGFRLRTACLSR
jgi:DNA polymerase-4